MLPDRMRKRQCVMTKSEGVSKSSGILLLVLVASFCIIPPITISARLGSLFLSSFSARRQTLEDGITSIDYMEEKSLAFHDNVTVFNEDITESFKKEPSSIERALFAVSMGEKAAESKIVERFVWSARNVGMYSGWIVILTDADPVRYEDIYNWTERVIFMAPDQRDIKTHYAVKNMSYKRFKTQVLEYIEKDTRLENVELVYYLDVDIVFGDHLSPFFDGLEQNYGIGIGRNLSANAAQGQVWMFHGNTKKWPVQGGQMILHRHQSRACQTKWRRLFDREDTAYVEKDQWLLLEMLEEQVIAEKLGNASKLECQIRVMNQRGFIDFPGARELKRKNKLLKKRQKHYGDFKYAPLVHLRNDGATMSLSTQATKYYMKDLLRLTDGRKDELGIIKKAVMEVTPKKST